MRLKSVFIGQYKNLRNFELSFDGTSFLDVFVGKNGSGKSNLFEALLEIFRHLIDFGSVGNTVGFDYRVSYELAEQEVHFEWAKGRLLVNGTERASIERAFLPDNLLVYYSGHNGTVGELIAHYATEFRERMKRIGPNEDRWVLGIGPEYKSLLLVLLLLQPDDNPARKYVVKKLGIERLGNPIPGDQGLTEPVIRIVLERPEYAKGNKRFDIALNDETDRYWKAEGVVKRFLDGLTKCEVRLSERFTIDEGYFPNEDRYILSISIVKLLAEYGDRGALWLFRQFDNLKTLGMLAEISVPLRLTGGAIGGVQSFSDGQFQSVYIYAIAELFKESNCLMLLDEPDAFLHPEWQLEFLKQVFDISETTKSTSHVLMTSHSAMTLCPLDVQKIRLLSLKDSSSSWSYHSKREVIRELSNSFILYSEDEGKLLIENVIRTSTRPILFVEGPSDVSILDEAYRKLYGTSDVPILIQDAFDRGFIRTLFARHEIFNAYPNKTLFAIFDFDDAYEDWRELKGNHEVTDIGLGLCKKLRDKNAYALMLPIPDNQLRNQVLDEANPNEKIRLNRHFCIEHAFWGIAGLENWFRTDHASGFVTFKGDKYKIKFATEVVPKLDAGNFEIFRPIFEFVSARCTELAPLGAHTQVPIGSV